jgi:hypothetical protein
LYKEEEGEESGGEGGHGGERERESTKYTITMTH